MRLARSWVCRKLLLICTLSQPFVIAGAVRVPYPITNLLSLLNVVLTSAGVRIRRLGIRLSYHRSPRASHPCDSCHLAFLSCLFILESQYGITNESFRGFPLAYGWLAKRLIYIVCCVNKLCTPCSHFPCFHLRRFNPGTAFLRQSSLWNCQAHAHTNQKLKGDIVFQEGPCIGLGLRRTLPSAVGVLVVDTVLFMSMLIGILRYAHRSSTGIWYLLYQQVIPGHFSSTSC